ncbi:hypothetical protein QN372_00685 [Undibacterium sp. RTI2.1]|uniref:hypothetical protein n=1 Tax=unclassified Undibacterium TaxID=2630295 RepID=UPI002AB3A38F|nr:MULTISPECIES: hypothetical protein [unclassified Undibacterium]MDY7537652.1 hypothetical protein [Undibacterium sp. 5I1]MEB0029254.1 hypothetical protein [Undibacterium sp. RTI2.1]MEB0115562.1 hypothetical protein [Undibacterium sp. RTI2.2]MEB0256389.1 hypothetical protein [Undibacterium sp. 5I1]
MIPIDLKTGDKVAFRCHIFGEVTGTIHQLMRCLTNGQQHAIVQVTLSGEAEMDCCEPLINLRKLA